MNAPGDPNPAPDLGLPKRLQDAFDTALRLFRSALLSGQVECRIDTTPGFRRLREEGLRLSANGQFEEAIAAFSQSWKSSNQFDNLSSVQNCGMQYVGLAEQWMSRGVPTARIGDLDRQFELAERLFVQVLVRAQLGRLTFQPEACDNLTAEALYGLAVVQKDRALTLWQIDGARRGEAREEMRGSSQCLEAALRYQSTPAFSAALEWTRSMLRQMDRAPDPDGG
jgi:hypothetical protein